jgi:ribosomal protein L11 methyltransferase
MPWLQVRLAITPHQAAVLEDQLLELGAVSVTFMDAEDQPIFEPDLGTTPLWTHTHLLALFEDGTDTDAVLAQLKLQRGGELPEYQVERIEDQDWERSWMDNFQPMRFGRRLWIVPGGMEIPGQAAGERHARVEISLDPGLAFGTGTHPTTALCLEWLDAQPAVAGCVVDYGCGSGVLAIAAALLGAARVVCVDNDPQALEATAANAARNAVADRVHCLAPEAFAEAGADIVLANILAGPLMRLAPRLTQCVRAGGRIVLSGLLEEQLEEVAAAWCPTCAVTGSVVREGWARLELEKL